MSDSSITALAEQIDAILPQTQCTQCGYAGCRPYADALARGEARINQCPPGGEAGIHVLAHMLGLPYISLDPAHGVEKPRSMAVIDESTCIGCTLCIKACPVDAILGAHKQMHTVIADECTGCELCIAPCPVDCISMQALEEQDWHYAEAGSQARQMADAARARHMFRLQRQESASKNVVPAKPQVVGDTVAAKKAAIAAAMARARALREQGMSPSNISQKT
ncbi:electron transport complex protein RnfB [Methylobacillus rhizosphaerae]|uniref:Electron transport complex protein RnfB n=1 Tax=Methylobacillus rhizosphaerae TaxID=551994 RepID=A0A238Z0V3_9PROT|nr:electron transport complex subunit RsxB [Methylobacillus rhizosphaerae]SNR76551.1 electron transport complex protein RnfB [Methylobacillus rhizosphaerae]